MVADTSENSLIKMYFLPSDWCIHIHTQTHTQTHTQNIDGNSLQYATKKGNKMFKNWFVESTSEQLVCGELSNVRQHVLLVHEHLSGDMHSIIHELRELCS